MKKYLITTKGYFTNNFNHWLKDYADNDVSFDYGYIKLHCTEQDRRKFTGKMIQEGIKIIDIFTFNEQTQQYE